MSKQQLAEALIEAINDIQLNSYIKKCQTALKMYTLIEKLIRRKYFESFKQLKVPKRNRNRRTPQTLTAFQLKQQKFYVLKAMLIWQKIFLKVPFEMIKKRNVEMPQFYKRIGKQLKKISDFDDTTATLPYQLVGSQSGQQLPQTSKHRRTFTGENYIKNSNRESKELSLHEIGNLQVRKYASPRQALKTISLPQYFDDEHLDITQYKTKGKLCDAVKQGKIKLVQYERKRKEELEEFLKAQQTSARRISCISPENNLDIVKEMLQMPKRQKSFFRRKLVKTFLIIICALLITFLFTILS